MATLEASQPPVPVKLPMFLSFSLAPEAWWAFLRVRCWSLEGPRGAEKIFWLQSFRLFHHLAVAKPSPGFLPPPPLLPNTMASPYLCTYPWPCTLL